jgi:hypothetical protein
MALDRPRHNIAYLHDKDEAGARTLGIGFPMSQIRDLSALEYRAFLANRDLNRAQWEHCRVGYMINLLFEQYDINHLTLYCRTCGGAKQTGTPRPHPG